MSKILFQQEALRAVAPFMSTEEARYYLRGVYFEDRLLVTTDGHRMGVVKPAEFGGCVKENFIMPAETVKAILKVKAKKYGKVWVEVDTKTFVASVYINKPDADQPQLPVVQLRFSPTDGTYPDWRRVIPDASNYEKPCVAAFNAEYLGAFASFGRGVTMFLNKEPKAPCIIRASCMEYEAFGVLMPMRGDITDKVSHPEWLGVKKVAAATEHPGKTDNCVSA